MTIKKERQSVITALQTKLGPNSSTNYEKRIYTMCTVISESEGTPIKEVYRREAFEKVGDLLAQPNRAGRDKVLIDIKGCVIGYDSIAYHEFREKLREENALMAKGVEVKEGAFPCRNPKCKSNRCYFYQLQTRSGDEGMSTFVVCIKCKTRRKFN